MSENQDGSSSKGFSASAGGEISTARALFPFSQAQVHVSRQSHTRFTPNDRGRPALVSDANQNTRAPITMRRPPPWRKVGIACTHASQDRSQGEEHAGGGGWNSHPSLDPGQDRQLGEGASARCTDRITLHCSTCGTAGSCKCEGIGRSGGKTI